MNIADRIGESQHTGHRPDELCQPNRVKEPLQRSVGTGGREERMRGPCACPRAQSIRVGSRNPDEACGEQDRHKAPALPLIHPLSLQDCGPQAAFLLPDAVGKIHQDAGATCVFHQTSSENP